MADETPSAPTPTPTESAPADPGASSAPSDSGTTLLTDGKTPEGSKPASDPSAQPEAQPDDKAAAPVIPEKYEINLGEGVKVDTGALEAMTPIFKEIGLTQENAQKLVSSFNEYASKAAKEFTARQAQENETQYQQFLKEEEAKHIGALKKEWGSEFEPNTKALHKAYSDIASRIEGGAEVTQLLKQTGLGNHPGFARLFLKIAPLIREDNPLVNGANPERKSLESVLYPSMQPH